MTLKGNRLYRPVLCKKYRPILCGLPMFKKQNKLTIQDKNLLRQWKARPLKYKIGDFLEYVGVTYYAPRPLFESFRPPKRKRSVFLAFSTLILPFVPMVAFATAGLVQFIRGCSESFPFFHFMVTAFFFVIGSVALLSDYSEFRRNLIEFLKRGFFQAEPKKWLNYFKASVKSKGFWKI